MTGAISIRPSKDLRTNYAQISALSRENPVAITVNGKETDLTGSMTEQEKEIARLKNISQDEVLEAAWNNACRFYRLNEDQ